MRIFKIHEEAVETDVKMAKATIHSKERPKEFLNVLRQMEILNDLADFNIHDLLHLRI